MHTDPRGLPPLYTTEQVEIADKLVIEHWLLRSVNFHWWIVEYDPVDHLFFGYANLNDDINAEWGYIDEHELVENHAEPEHGWQPKQFQDCVTESYQLALLYPASPIILIPISRVDPN